MKVSIEILFMMLCFVASVHLSSEHDDDRDENLQIPSFDEWKKVYGKSFASDEEEKRRKVIFEEKCEMMKKHNARYTVGEVTYFIGVNEFSALTKDEFRNLYLESDAGRSADFSNSEPSNKESDTKRRVKRQAPVYFDWRSTGKVAGAQDQGYCGAGYAFAAISTIDSQAAIRCGGSLVKLSEQQIVDCSGPQGNEYCVTGTPQFSYKYLMINTGINLAVDYRYTSGSGGVVNLCHYNSTIVAKFRVTGFINFPFGEASLLAAVLTYGPIAVQMDCDHDSFQSYAGGVYSEPQCSNSPDLINHSMVVVGYGTGSTGQQFWAIKNSWSTTWGISGFVKVARNANNMCCVACRLSSPTVACL